MKLLMVITLFILAGCAHSIHEVHTSDFNGMKSGAPQIEGYGEQLSIMGFTQETNYVNDAYNGLLRKCNGRVTGITTKYWTSLSFMSWTNKVKMTGYCVN